MKAFLSHSSRDKEFVRAVANELGRQFSVFDEQAFESGTDFKRSIETGLDESAVFVLFASKLALESVWVQFEMEEAWYQKLQQKLNRAIVYLIDSAVGVESLPEWLRRARIVRATSPKPTARDIRHHLDDLLRERQHPFLVGRSADTEALEHTLTPLDGSNPPRAVVVSGLPGIGRRSLIRHTVPVTLNLRKFIEIRLGEGDSIHDICIGIAAHVEPYSTQEGFARIVVEIRSLDENQARDRAILNLRRLVSSGELPIFYDEGGLLDVDGFFRDPIHALLSGLSVNDEAYVFFVSHRRPQRNDTANTPVLHLRSLGGNETKRLVTMIAHRTGLEISATEAAELSEYVAGYPPAAYFAIQQARTYGLALVLADKTRLVQFRTSRFLRHLAQLSLSEGDIKLLRLLSLYSPLPIGVLLEVLETPLATLQSNLINLIDLALVVTTEQSYYRIADPIVDASIRSFGYPGMEEHRAVAFHVKHFLYNSEGDVARLELSRLLFRAARLAEDPELAEESIYFASDLISLVETLYHERKYAQVIETGSAALYERPESQTARSYFVRALIQEERWQEASTNIHEARKFLPGREIAFLSGFLERKRNNIRNAIEHYKEAEQLGRTSAGLYRELALCYYLVNDLVSAENAIRKALDRQGDNPFVIDLWAQIASKRGDEQSARNALARLQATEQPARYLHRLSRIELAFGRIEEAREAASQAVASESYPHLEVLAQLAYCDIELGMTDEAEELLVRIDREFPNIRHDVRTGLRCRLEIAKKRFGVALAISERIREKDTIFYKNIRVDALLGELASSALPDRTRAAYLEEIEALQSEAANFSLADFLSEE